ncbi:MAG: amidophosphoribosyltransferase [Acetivibrionales bacterium]|jgi:amidophosphoribosyltransferase
MGYDIRLDKMKEECGVFGIYSNDNLDVALLSYYALYALQHRGQESAGIAVNDSGTILHHKDMGLVPEVFNDVVLEHLEGKMAIGHVRYSTTGASLRENAQPMVIKYRNGQLALAHNGNLVNAADIRKEMEEKGAIFQSTNDTEVIANLISRYRVLSGSIEDTLVNVIRSIKGSYAITILTPRKLIGMRDPLGIRPLCIGKIGNSYVLSSESCALDAIEAEFVRDVRPGEIVIIDEDGIKSIQTEASQEGKLCIFEFVYFARPDSILDGANVNQARLEAGRRLAIEYPVDADVVIGAPDSGLNAAIGYSMESGIQYGQGLLKNRYVGRTFIKPDQGQRETSVRIKFNAMRDAVKDKRVVMVDDSIVRGTTTRRIVQMLKDAGAKEVHMRVSSPPVKFPCFFGMDIASRKQLVASNLSVEEIRESIGADSLGYLSLEGLLKTPVNAKCGFCTACFCGNYPMEVPAEGNKMACGG